LQVSADIPLTRTTLFLDLCPEMISTCRRGMSKSFVKRFTNSSFASPSTGGAAMRIRSAPSTSPATPLRDARGCTRTGKVNPLSVVVNLITELQEDCFYGRCREDESDPEDDERESCEHAAELEDLQQRRQSLH
jgi:hypothetical protein